MATEVIDIQIRETGAAPAAAGVAAVGTAAVVAEGQLGSFNSMVSSLTNTLGLLGLAFSASKIIQQAEAYNELIERLKTVSKSSKDLIDQEQKLFDLAQRTRQSLDGTISLYVGLKKATNDLHLEQSTLLSVVGTINQALIVSRKSGEDVSGAMRRFAASLAQGKVDGRGLNTILLQFPALAKAMADGFNGGVGISVGRLRELAQAGQVTARQIVQSLVVAGPKVAEAFKRTQVTLSESFTVLGNAVERQIGLMDQGAGATHLMAEAILVVARNIGTILPTLLALGAGLTAMGIAAGLARVGVLSLFTVIAANPFTFLVGAIVTAIALVYEFGNSVKLTADGSITLLGAMVGAWRVLVEALTIAYNFIVTNVVAAFNFLSNAVQQLNQWLQQNPIAMQLVIGGLTAVGVALAAAAVAASPLILALGALAAAFIAGYAAMLYFKGGSELVSQKFTEMKNSITSSVSGITEQLRTRFGDAMREATNETNKSGLAAKDWGDTFSKTVPDAVNVVKFGTDQMRNGFQGVTQDINGMGSAMTGASLTVKNAMGEMVTAESDWALRSGQFFNQVKGQASSMSSSVSSSLDSMSSSFDRASSSGGGGSGGGPGQSVAHIAQGSSGSGGGTVDLFIPWTYQTGGQYGPYSKQIVDMNNLLVSYGTPFGPDALQKIREKFKADPELVKETLYWRPDIAHIAGYKYGGDFQVGGAGGTDSQLVQFMATPGEHVSVETPQQRRGNSRYEEGGGQRPIIVNMTVVTPDANSFRRSETQLTTELAGKIGRVQQTLKQ